MSFYLGAFLIGLLIVSPAVADPQFKGSTVQVLMMDAVGGKDNLYKNYFAGKREDRFNKVMEKIGALFDSASVGYALYEKAGVDKCATDPEPFGTAAEKVAKYKTIEQKAVAEVTDASYQGTIIAMTNSKVMWQEKTSDGKPVVKVILLTAEGKPKDAPAKPVKPMKGDGKDTCDMDAPNADLLKKVLEAHNVAIVVAVPKGQKDAWKDVEKFPFKSSVIEMDFPTTAEPEATALDTAITAYAAAVEAAVKQIAEAYKPGPPNTSTPKPSSAARYSAALATAVFVGSQAF